MADGLAGFKLPYQAEGYLRLLNKIYELNGEALLSEVLVNSPASVDEATHYDNYDGGIHGHTLKLAVPDDLFVRIFGSRRDIEERITSDLYEMVRMQGERFASVILEPSQIQDERWREEAGAYHRVVTSPAPPQVIERIWGQYPMRIFLSHKAGFKEETSALKQALAWRGIGAFVAHEDIEPTLEWHREIEHALFSMDALVALLTADFHDSNWTDQEVGVAIGRGVPVIAVRLGGTPYGLMGTRQALGGCAWAHPERTAVKLFELLEAKLVRTPKLFEAAIYAYRRSKSYGDSEAKVAQLLSRFQTATPSQIDMLLEAWEANSQNQGNRGSYRLMQLLQRWTGEKWSAKGGVIHRVEPEPELFPKEEDLPF